MGRVKHSLSSYIVKALCKIGNENYLIKYKTVVVYRFVKIFLFRLYLKNAVQCGSIVLCEYYWFWVLKCSCNRKPILFTENLCTWKIFNWILSLPSQTNPIKWFSSLNWKNLFGIRVTLKRFVFFTLEQCCVFYHLIHY